MTHSIKALARNLTMNLTLILTILIIAGCGQSGPLYLPGNPSEMREIPPEPAEKPEDEDDERNDDR